MKKKEQAIILTGITSLLILGEFIKKKARTYRELFYKEQEFFQLCSIGLRLNSKEILSYSTLKSIILILLQFMVWALWAKFC